MKVLRIKSHSMHDALAEARRQLGDGATILHTKQYDTPVMFGLGRRQEVEILAAAEAPVPVNLTAVATASKEAAAPVVTDVARQIADIKSMLTSLEAKQVAQVVQDPSPAISRLVRNGVSEKLAESLAPELQLVKELGKYLDSIAQRIRCSGPVDVTKRQSRVALIGPTGVGKTTTAAKLAAQHTIVGGKKVALITVDTYRVGAVEQLATYARILNIPIEVALCPEDVDALIGRHQDKDLIIIDSVGRSQRSRSHLLELSQFIRAANPTEVHLVVSASSSLAVQKEAISSFGALSADRLILTKLDECPQPGCILDLSVSSLLPFSYITYGQEVPDDIAVAESGKLASLVWEGMP